MKSIQELVDIMAALRDPKTGCPWDRQQTKETIIPYTLEEIYELVDAVERNNMEDIRDELGDLLFHVIFYSQMASETGSFDLTDVVSSVCDKPEEAPPPRIRRAAGRHDRGRQEQLGKNQAGRARRRLSRQYRQGIAGNAACGEIAKTRSPGPASTGTNQPRYWPKLKRRSMN